MSFNTKQNSHGTWKDKYNYLGVSNVSESFFNLSQVFYVNSLYERFPNEDLGVRILRRNLK